MISRGAIVAWSEDHPWPRPDQVEQDLILSRAICAIADDDYLGRELVFRGGTALHKLHLPEPLRYSEDLDYVRTTGGGIRELTSTLTLLGESLGFDVRTRVSQHPKVFWRTTSQTGNPLRIKIEVNTHERSPALPHVMRPYAASSLWWSGTATVRTFDTVELVATKIRALYQRSKGRDLFDLWLALDALALDPAAILEAFGPYRPEGLTSALAIANVRAKLRESAFRNDLAPLTIAPPQDFDLDVAAERVITDLLSRLDETAPTPSEGA